MVIIKSVNQEYRGKRPYPFPQDVRNLLRYIGRPEATMYPQGAGQYLIGMGPDIISADQPGALEYAVELFDYQFEAFEQHPASLVMHRIISFEDKEVQDPVMAFMLAKEVAAFYFDRGYISFFGVHTDTDNIHIHLAVSAINWRNGRKFFIYDELGLLAKVINWWCQNYIRGTITPLLYKDPIN